jgi:hypothetical protein
MLPLEKRRKVPLSGDYFAGLGVSAIVGRTLNEADDLQGTAREGWLAGVAHSAIWRDAWPAWSARPRRPNG